MLMDTTGEPAVSKHKDFKWMLTEERNPRTMDLDVLDTQDLVKRIQAEDLEIAQRVAEMVPDVARAVDIAAAKLSKGGRMIYFGAGTSGRLGVLDATECPPTFGIEKNMVQACIAGGRDAMFQAAEAAEDSEELGRTDATSMNVSGNDIVVGISASGRTPYVLGACKKAKEEGATIVALVSNPHSELESIADISITAVVGPEALTGSTRMKGGTAHKMILNLLSTSTMVKLGKVYENLMVDLKPTNEKLRERATSIICTICDVPRHIAEGALVASNNRAKTAILMIDKKLGRVQAEELLSKCGNSLRKALQTPGNSQAAASSAKKTHPGCTCHH
jgi:N-acetylmuramic acid 6-phosphate etherase